MYRGKTEGGKNSAVGHKKEVARVSSLIFLMFDKNNG